MASIGKYPNPDGKDFVLEDEGLELTFKMVEEAGGYFAVGEGILYWMPTYKDNSYDGVECYSDVTAPESQESLDFINQVFGTNFRFENFEHR